MADNESLNQQNEWFWQARVFVMMLKTALEEGDLDLARTAIKEVISILSEISCMYHLYIQEEEFEHLQKLKGTSGCS